MTRTQTGWPAPTLEAAAATIRTRLLPWALLLSPSGCTRDDVTLLGAAPDGGASTDDAGTADAGSCTSLCLALGGVCGADEDCCSDLCRDQRCVADTKCAPAGAACDTASSCCSGRCEPTPTGPTCTDFCSAPGAVCTRAADCCGYDCNSGRCGGPLCRQRNDDCTSDAECCSGRCSEQDSRCADVEALSCRASFESCESGSGGACCHGCDDTSQRCAPSEQGCRARGEPCSSDGACCTGTCDAQVDGVGACGGACAAAGSACTHAGECCSGLCAGEPGRCLTPGSAPSCG
jgi:hypothetical protein